MEALLLVASALPGVNIHVRKSFIINLHRIKNEECIKGAEMGSLGASCDWPCLFYSAMLLLYKAEVYKFTDKWNSGWYLYIVVQLLTLTPKITNKIYIFL